MIMARGTQDILTELKQSYIDNDELRRAYGIREGVSFDEHFPKSSVETRLLYVVAYCVHILERLFDVFRSDVAEELDSRMAHRTKWYRHMVLRYRHGVSLIPERDKYDNTGLTPEDIAEAETVKYCAVEERGHHLYIKTAKGEVGSRTPLSPQEVLGLQTYIQEIKDAGVVFSIINEQADRFYCEVKIYYNPMLLNPEEKPVEKEIKRYISMLDFNGEYTHVGLVDTLQRIPGVVIPHLVEVRLQRENNPPHVCEVKEIAHSGYWVVGDDNDIRTEYVPYNTYEHER